MSGVYWAADPESYQKAILDRLELWRCHCSDLCCDDQDTCRCDCRWCDCRYAERMGS